MRDLYKYLPPFTVQTWWVIGVLAAMAAWFAIPWRIWALTLVTLASTASLLIFPLSYFAMYPPDSIAERIGWGLITSGFWAVTTFTVFCGRPLLSRLWAVPFGPLRFSKVQGQSLGLREPPLRHRPRAGKRSGALVQPAPRFSVRPVPWSGIQLTDPNQRPPRRGKPYASGRCNRVAHDQPNGDLPGDDILEEYKPLVCAKVADTSRSPIV